MAIEELQSTAITAMEAIRTGSGSTPASKVIHGGVIKECVATFEAGIFDALSTYRICRLPSYARLSQIIVKGDTALVGGPIDIGVYRTPAHGGAVVDLDILATDIDVATAAITTTELNSLWDVLDIANVEQRLWEMAGLSADPGQQLDIVMTTSTAITTGGTITFVIRYVDGD